MGECWCAIGGGLVVEAGEALVVATVSDGDVHGSTAAHTHCQFRKHAGTMHRGVSVTGLFPRFHVKAQTDGRSC